MYIVFVNECAADGCYKKKLKKGIFCKGHQDKIDKGEIVIAYYGKKVKRKEPSK